METFLVLPIIVLCVALAVWFGNYVCSLPERRKNEALLRREALLFNEKIRAERYKQLARAAGANARNEIDRIAGLYH